MAPGAAAQSGLAIQASHAASSWLGSGQVDDVAGVGLCPSQRANEQPRVTELAKMRGRIGPGLAADHEALTARVVKDRRVPVISGKGDEFTRLRVGGDELRRRKKLSGVVSGDEH